MDEGAVVVSACVANGEDSIVGAAVPTALGAAGTIHATQGLLGPERPGFLLLLVDEVLVVEGAPLGRRRGGRRSLLAMSVFTKPGLVVVHLHVDMVVAHLA